ncbi:hypothetical protein RZ57_03980 [[Haemophilus] ducreyi]|uniref:Uncharacterized protein n=1 Tax=Haemophilus ducreyi TaxID=730 RepID=A0AAC8UC78_HAEDC|nr:hypothetical protein RZ57_03980 [[Haemophilus] ducreyi]AKO33787.1 hypothetical protein RZ58_03995 [[Haemophilus] ducreyi]
MNKKIPGVPLSVKPLEPNGSRELSLIAFRLLTQGKLAHQRLDVQLKVFNYRLRDVTNNEHPR